MRKTALLSLLLALLLLLCSCSGSGTDSSRKTTKKAVTESKAATESTKKDTSDEMLLKIEINNYAFYADFESNSSAEALKEKLRGGSITLKMNEYGGFEKVGDLPFDLPRNDEKITTEPGDVILYQGNKITVYYGENTWEFTKLAKIRNADKNLKDILGKGDVTAVFSLTAPQ